MSNKIAELAELCLAHLVREETALRASRDGLTLLHGAFLRGTFAELQSAILKCQELSEQTYLATSQRDELCGRFAEAMSVDREDVRLSALSAWLPSPYSERVLACRDKLQALASEVDRLNKRVAHLATYCRTFLQKAVEESTGQTGKTIVQYGPAGRRAETRGSLLIANG